jgi:hypothetical protein
MLRKLNLLPAKSSQRKISNLEVAHGNGPHQMPTADFRSATRSVRSQVNSGNSRPK